MCTREFSADTPVSRVTATARKQSPRCRGLRSVYKHLGSLEDAETSGLLPPRWASSARQRQALRIRLSRLAAPACSTVRVLAASVPVGQGRRMGGSQHGGSLLQRSCAACSSAVAVLLETCLRPGALPLDLELPRFLHILRR